MSQESKVGKSTELILTYLRAQSSPIAEKQILKSVRGRKQVKVVALRVLVAELRVSRSGAGKKANPYLYATNNSPRKPFSWDDDDGEELLL